MKKLLRLLDGKMARLKVLTLTILSLTILLLIGGCVGAKETQKIVIGLDDGCAPMGFRDAQGNIVGFDVDLAKETARRMNVAIEFKPISWNNKKLEITSGKIDMIWNGCDIMPEYKEYMIFSKPYMDNRQIILVRKGDTQGIHAVDDLAGKIVATQAGSNSEDYIDSNPKLRDSFSKFMTYNNVKEGFEFLSAGKFDVIIVDEIAARYEIMKNPDAFEIIELTIGPVTEFGIGFRKNDVELRDRVQKVFDEMIKDGTAKKISEQWFQADLIKARR